MQYTTTIQCPCFFQRGKTVPEELVRAEDLSKYRQVASHAVNIDFCLSENSHLISHGLMVVK